MAMASLASSDGWKFMTPSGIQRRAPLTPLPTCGTSTSASSTSEAANSHGATFSQAFIGTCSATTAHSSATAIDSTWRVRKWVVA